jgi:hypothetical protein
MLMSRYQNAGHALTAIKSFENEAKFRYLKMAVTKKNFIHDIVKEEILAR